MLAGTILGPRGEVLSTPQSARTRSLAEERAKLRARFDAAQTTTENTRHWSNADYLGPNSELDPGVRRTLRSRARYECANNTYASGMIRTLANDTIGTGPWLQLTDPEIPKAESAAVENAFWDWSQAVRLPQKLRLMRQAKARDGETFAQFFINRRALHPVRLDFNVFEADMVATTIFNTSLTNILDGLFVDDFGNVTAYNVLREHPGEVFQFLLAKADVIPADQIIHLFHADRPGQYRGCPEITAALPLFAQLRRYTLAVIRAAESAALPSWLLETQQPPSDMVFGDAFETLETERGMGVVLPGGYKMSQLKAEQPTSTYPQFKREILSEIARCLAIPYNVAAGDSSSYNYSSARLEIRNWQKALRVERSYIESAALRVIFANWWDQAAAVPGLLPQGLFGATLPMHEWRWDGDEHVDPFKEAKGQETRLKNYATTLRDEYARQGQDWEVALRQIAREQELMRELEIPLPGQNASSTADQVGQAVQDLGELSDQGGSGNG